MDRNERIAQALDRLFRTYLQSGSSLEDRVERAAVYFDAVAPYEVEDIEAAVHALLTGTAPGVNPSFAPPAPAVAAETRRQLNLRLDKRDRERINRPALPPPLIEHTPESQARVKAKAAALIEHLAGLSRTDEAAAEKRRRDGWGRVHARFDPDMSEDAVRKRLGFSVGDPIGDRDVA